MRKRFSFFFLAVILFASCKKDPQKLVIGTWNIESITFNNENKMSDLSLLGIVKISIGYDHDYAQTYNGGSGGMSFLNGNDSSITGLGFNIGAKSEDTLECCGYDRFKSYLPGMVDTNSCKWPTLEKEYWHIVELSKRKFLLELNFQGDIYIVDMKRE